MKKISDSLDNTVSPEINVQTTETCDSHFTEFLKVSSIRRHCLKGPLVISMKISPRRVEKYFIFSTLLAGTKIMSK